MIMLNIILSTLLFFWFKREISLFHYRTHKNIYNEMNSVINLKFSLNQFIKESTITRKNCTKEIVILPLLIFIPLYFQHKSENIILISMILVYLSLLDYTYYLTEIKYIGIIFTLSLIHTLTNDKVNIDSNITCLLFTIIFFISFNYIAEWVIQREAIGFGDILLLIALSPLFTIEGIALLLFIASLAGIVFYEGYYLYKKERLSKLPFIPFITIGFILTI
ncbi:A24 family peptidase [Otariodibacter sp.]|uniref:prepilin peptidase n=1 Tax=Otariodibacter sp. TaxID=3030919 RepID=UPI00261CC33C|nr:A24 family peptidase [Otariodibacter sp.]